jgi:hypothetical protein
MKQLLAVVLGLLCLAGALGCAKAPFTQGVRERFGLTRDDLRRIQFFTSEEIVLQRELNSQTRAIQGSELVIHDDVRIERIVVSNRTPCVALRVEGEYLLAGFSPRDPGAALWFRAQQGQDALKSPDGRRYELATLENALLEEGPFEPRWSKGFLVNWSGSKYHVVAGRDSYLLYEMDDDFEQDEVEHSPPGWRVSDKTPPRLPAGDAQPALEAPAPAPDAGGYDEL